MISSASPSSKADAEGVVTATGAGAGEVVQAGQMISGLPAKDGRDAVFDVPAQVFDRPRAIPNHRQPYDDPSVRRSRAGGRTASRSRDPDVRGQGRPDRSSRRMRLGATVTGTHAEGAVPVIEIPATALTKINQPAAVWVVDPADRPSRSGMSTCCDLTRRR